MDTSKQYIKMCEGAEEIQGEAWPLGIREPNFQSQNGADVSGSGDWWYLNTWLPRQDQLQEMVTVSHEVDYNNSMYPILEKLWEFSCTLYLMKNPPTSMEQLWLAFVMKSLYSKTWNGSEWILDKQE